MRGISLKRIRDARAAAGFSQPKKPRPLDVFIARLRGLPDYLHNDASLTEPEAADFLGVSHSTLQKMRLDGTGPTYLDYSSLDKEKKRPMIRYVLRDLKEFVELNTVQARPKA